MTLVIIILTIGINPPIQNGYLEEEVDVIEFNLVWDVSDSYFERGKWVNPPPKITFEQIIFRRWDEKTQYHQIIAWKINDIKNLYTTIDTENKILFYRDGEILRKIHYKSIRYTGYLYDVELYERGPKKDDPNKYWGHNDRPGLKQLKKD